MPWSLKVGVIGPANFGITERATSHDRVTWTLPQMEAVEAALPRDGTVKGPKSTVLQAL